MFKMQKSNASPARGRSTPAFIFIAVLAFLMLGLYFLAPRWLDPQEWTRHEAYDTPEDLEWNEEAERLEALGYLGGSEPVPERTGVLLSRTGLAQEGLNLYTSTGDLSVRLMDMSGNLVHIWTLDVFQLPAYQAILDSPAGDEFPNMIEAIGTDEPVALPVLHAYLYPNGDILIVYRGMGLIKLNKDSKLLWHVPGDFHHDIDVLPDGRIYTFDVKIEARNPSRFSWLRDNRPTRMDYIVSFDKEGRELKRFSVLKAFERSKFRHALAEMPEAGDITHSNEIVYLDGSKTHLSPLYQKGNLLISCREIDAIAIVDPQREEVVWAMRGPWKKQHSPVLLENGNILLFDNRGMGEHSRVLEIEPASKTIIWSYGEKPGQDLYSWECGATQRLENGNTLITESSKGRALEVTPQREVVWEFINPHERNSKIATLFRVYRLDFAYTSDWLNGEE